MKNVNIEQFTKEKLPPMSFSQKCFMIMIVCYVTLLLLPSFLPKTLALLTPAASPYCGMMHARTDAISLKEILKLGFPMCIIAVLVYTFIGFPIANFLF